MSDDKLQVKKDNFESYKEKVDKSYKDELSLFERFSKDINRRAYNQHQVTLNNLAESKESLESLKEKVKELKQSIFYHEEELIVDRQKIIKDTESKIQKQNINIIEFEYKNAQDKVMNFDYLNKALIQSSFDYFNELKMYYSKDIIDLDELYNFLVDKNKTFEKIIQKYETEVFEFFSALDNEIFEMNSKIALLMQQKNSQLNKIYEFYQKETSAYIDNQMTFSAETNIESEEINSLINDKINQFSAFKKHLLDQEKKIKLILNDEYLALYDKVLNKLLQRKGNIIINDPDFFDHPEEILSKLKEEIVFANNEDSKDLGSLIKTYKEAKNYPKYIENSKQKAKSLTNKFLKMKKNIFFEYQKESRRLINQMDKYYKMYLAILRVDPFLAQIIGDKATKIVKDEVNYLDTLRINKEHKINVNFDIKTLKLNQQINEIEAQLIYEIERQMYLQDIDLLSNILDIQTYFIEKKADTALSMNHLNIEKQNIFKLDKAISAYLKNDILINNVNRKFLSFVTGLIVKHIRTSEAYEIELVESLADVKLALKEYDITAVHFRTMFENEKRFLTLQANRVNEENQTHNDFILTTYENQMRFAKEQVTLAHDEFNLRIEAITTAVEEERDYYLDIINNEQSESKKKENDLLNEYQAKLYKEELVLAKTDDKKKRKQIEKQLSKLKQNYDSLIHDSELNIDENTVIKNARLKLRTLNDHYQEALEEAMNLRDETIEEMEQLYEMAKKRYDYYLTYSKNKIDPLEPTFYQSLEQMKNRYLFKLKTAEAELDYKTSDLLDNYKKIYFSKKPEIDQTKLKETIEKLQGEKEKINLAYQKELQDIEAEYQEIFSNLHEEKQMIITEARRLKGLVSTREENEIENKNHELQVLENEYIQMQDIKQNSFDKEIENLTNEYNSTLLESKKYIANLSTAFEKVLSTYKPYLRLTKNNRKIRSIMKKTNQEVTKKEKQELKNLKEKLKRSSMLINE